MEKHFENLTIRSAVLADAPQLRAWWNDGSVMAHAGFPLGLGTTEEKVRRQIESESDDTLRRHILEYRGQPIGEMVYRHLGDGVYDIGIKICEASMRNRGLGKLALSLFLQGLFQDLGAKKVVLDTNLRNLRAQHVYEQLGFRKVRVCRDSWTDQLGQLQSAVEYELLPEQFAPCLYHGALTHVYFVRHAQPNYENHNDLTRELTPKGLADRELVTRYLRDKSIDAVLSSPYRRSVDTVKDFADRKNLPVITVEDFRERKVGNGWIADFHDFSRMQWADFSYKRGDGESLAEVQRRNLAALQAVLRDYRGKSVAIGSHGTALCTVIHHYQPSFGFGDFQRIRELTPWIVHFVFDNTECVKIEAFNPFTEETQRVFHRREPHGT